MHLIAVYGDLTTGQIDPQCPHFEYGLAGIGVHCRKVAKSDADARQKFADAEGFGQIIVGAGVERDDFVLLLAAR